MATAVAPLEDPTVVAASARIVEKVIVPVSARVVAKAIVAAKAIAAPKRGPPIFVAKVEVD